MLVIILPPQSLFQFYSLVFIQVLAVFFSSLEFSGSFSNKQSIQHSSFSSFPFSWWSNKSLNLIFLCSWSTQILTIILVFFIFLYLSIPSSESLEKKLVSRLLKRSGQHYSLYLLFKQGGYRENSCNFHFL